MPPTSSAWAPINWPVDEKEDVLPDPKTQPARQKRRSTWAAAVAGIALLLAACSATPDPTPDPPPASARTPATDTPAAATTPTAAATPRAATTLHGTYVALGDSYTAGLGVPSPTGAVAGCGQSTSSYPYLAARSLRLDLTDMSCSSATIADMTAAQPTGAGTNPAQLSALSSGTALVTVSIGGNDIGIIGIVTKCADSTCFRP